MSREAVLEATNACIAKAEKMFGVRLSNVTVLFDITTARCRGMAGHKWGTYYLRFNPAYMATDLQTYIAEVIPHEVAHLVCYANPNLGRRHNPGWKRVCRMLGGTGRSTFTFSDVVPPDASLLKARKKRTSMTYRYVTASGVTVEMSAIRHGRLQRGARYRLKSTGEPITKEMYKR